LIDWLVGTLVDFNFGLENKRIAVPRFFFLLLASNLLRMTDRADVDFFFYQKARSTAANVPLGGSTDNTSRFVSTFARFDRAKTEKNSQTNSSTDKYYRIPTPRPVFRWRCERERLRYLRSVILIPIESSRGVGSLSRRRKIPPPPVL
jgi:hypothetical protein